MALAAYKKAAGQRVNTLHALGVSSGSGGGNKNNKNRSLAPLSPPWSPAPSRGHSGHTWCSSALDPITGCYVASGRSLRFLLRPQHNPVIGPAAPQHHVRPLWPLSRFARDGDATSPLRSVVTRSPSRVSTAPLPSRVSTGAPLAGRSGERVPPFLLTCDLAA